MASSDASHRRFVLKQPAAMSETWELREGGALVGTLRLGSVRRSAIAEVNGDTWRLEPRGVFRRRITVTRQGTGDPLARMQGRDLDISGGPSLRWGRLGSAEGSAFTRPDGTVAAQFSRVRESIHPSMEIDASTGDRHADLVCAVLGSAVLLLQRQAAAVSVTGAGG